MKLYTEEQVHDMILLSKKCDLTAEYLMQKMKPIELPSDEEMENRIKTHNPYPKQKQMHIDWSNGFERGAKWVIEQIKNKYL